MVKTVGKKSLVDAIEAIKKDEITYASFNKFEIRKDSNNQIKINQTSSNFTSFPVDALFVCFLETFEKSDLKPGMLVNTKGCDVYLVLDDECIICNDDCLFLKDYNDNLSNKYNTNCDIIAIYKKKKDYNANLEDLIDLRFVEKIADIKHQ